MGIVTNPGISGRVGPLVYYTLRGKQVVRALPCKYKQTKATRASASVFGKAARLASSIRSQMIAVMTDPKDNKMQTGFLSVVYKWIRSTNDEFSKGPVSPLNEFNFFEESASTVYQRGFPEVEVTIPSPGLVQIKIPSFIPAEKIIAPSNTRQMVCKISAGISDLKSNTSLGSGNTILNIEFNQTLVPEQIISFNMPTPENALLVVGASLSYQLYKSGKWQANYNRAFMPSGILHAVCL